MKLRRAEIRGFRCLHEVGLDFDDLTILLGGNSTGKSTVLRALKFFFEGDKLEVEDAYGRTGDGTISVQLTFESLTDGDREAFGLYAQGNQLVLTRLWSVGDAESRISGRALRYPGFDPIRAAQGRERTAAYRALRDARDDLELPAATNVAAVDAALLAWEMEHPDQCDTAEADAARFFGYVSVGQSRLSDRFKFVFVPGLRDAVDEATERKGSILERLLAAIAEQRAQADERLTHLEEETRTRYAEVVSESHGPTLDELAERLKGALQRFVPDASITLTPREASFRIDPPRVELRGGEAQDLSDLSRQGHGFQRTFIIAALEYLAETAAEAGGDVDRPTLFFAIEEPELYQHPPRARHFFATLRDLAKDEQPIQVCYATHSPYFVAASEYESIRLFRRQAVADEGLPAVTTAVAADPDAVVESLPENRRAEVDRYLARTMRDSFCEAFFARVAVIVEGPTDAAVIAQTASTLGVDFTLMAVTFVPVTKSAQPLAVAILRALGIPTYVIFDGDQDKGGKDAENAAATNRRILRAVGEAEADSPGTTIQPEWACFATNLENYLRTESEFERHCEAARDELGWSKLKSPEVYSEAIERLGEDGIPQALREIVENICRLI